MCNEDLTDENSVVINKRHYHKVCAETKQNIEAVRNFYIDNINGQVVFTYLNKVINDIVINKGVDAGFLLFALKATYLTDKNLTNPARLHYIVVNEDLKKKYFQLMNPPPNMSVQIDSEFDYTEQDYVPAKSPSKRFSDILK
jgi:hypothetical protein